ncbi:MAG: ATPase [Alphaproteobacteria bacterium]|nr:MAG: ATPase [Alphaproteobacteria bacterium]
MYTEYFKLEGRPFQLSPDPRFFFEARPHKKALAYLNYGISQSEGFIVITGEIGAGKTILVEHILSTFVGRNLIAAKVVTTQLNADDLLRMVAAAFDIPQEGVDKATILKRMEAFLIDSHRADRRVLLFVDEAQNLPHGALEELRMLSNIQVSGRSLLQIYLVGQPEFRRTIARKSLEQLRQRVITSYHLQPLDAEETRQYIEHRLHHVGWQNDPAFTAQAFAMIHEATGGVPRKINLLCDRLLLLAYLEEKHEIDAAIVKEVVMDMHTEGSAPALSA